MSKFTKSSDGMKIMIIGCGKVGATLAERLSSEGHEITVLDKSQSAVEELTSMYDVMGYVGNGASYTAQLEAGIEKCDLLIAVTKSDELNLLCCVIAKKFSGCSSIARVRTPDYSSESNFLREKLGLALIINPELEAAREIAHLIYLPDALDVYSFAHGQAEIIKFKIEEGSKLDGVKLADIGKSEFMDDIIICTIERNDDVIIPSGDYVISAGDVVSIVATRQYLKVFLKKLKSKSKRVKSCMLVGGGKSSYYLAKELIKSGIEVTIIEKNQNRCDELSVLLPKAIIINGDGTDEDFLKEVGITEFDSFVPLTSIDEENIFLSLNAKQVSDAKIVTKINHINFKNVINSLDLGSVIYPRYITSEAIIAYVRAKHNSKYKDSIETLYYMYDSRVEAIEFSIKKESEVTDVKLSELKLKENLLICVINRKGTIIIPSGEDVIKKGDTVVVVTKERGFVTIEDILA